MYCPDKNLSRCTYLEPRQTVVYPNALQIFTLFIASTPAASQSRIDAIFLPVRPFLSIFSRLLVSKHPIATFLLRQIVSLIKNIFHTSFLTHSVHLRKTLFEKLFDVLLESLFGLPYHAYRDEDICLRAL